jgi:hypothetical protein
MADNSQINNGTGDVIRDKDRAGVKTQIVGLDLSPGGGSETLMNGSMPVSLPANVTQLSQSLAMTSTSNAVTLSSFDGASALQIYVAYGTGSGTIAFEASTDGTNYFAISLMPVGGTATVQTASATGQWRGACGGYKNVRVRCSVTGANSVTVTITASVGAAETVRAEVFQATASNLNAVVSQTAAANLKAQISGDTSPGGTPSFGLPVMGTDGSSQGNFLRIDPTSRGLYVMGEVAHGATNAGNPVQMGVEAIAHGTNPTAVTAGQRTKLYANRAGVPFVIGGHPNVKTVRLNFTAAQTNTAIVTVSTGTKIVVTQVQVTVDNASTVFPQVIIGFATATTPTTTGVVASHPGVPAGGGFTRGDGSGILGIGADDEDLRITTTGTVGGNGCDVVCSYYTIEG